MKINLRFEIKVKSDDKESEINRDSMVMFSGQVASFQSIEVDKKVEENSKVWIQILKSNSKGHVNMGYPGMSTCAYWVKGQVSIPNS